MASKYWVGGTATWDATAGTKWALTSGGIGGISIPTTADDVFFDANSGVATITTSGNSTDFCRSLDCTGFTGTLTHASNTTINIGDGTAGAGNIALKIVSGMTYTAVNFVSAFSFVSTSATQQTIDFAGKSHGNLTINGAGSSYLLVSASTGVASASLTLTAGTFDTNGQACSWNSLLSSNSNVRTLALGSSVITILSNSTMINFTTATNLTLNAGTSAITCTGLAPTPQFGGKTFYDLVFNGSLDATFGNVTCHNFSRIGSVNKTYKIFITGPLTCTGTLTITGNSITNRLLVQSSTVGSGQIVTAAAVSLANVDFMDIVGAGAAAPFAGTSIGDCLGNSGIAFDTPATQTRTGAAGSWSTAGNWTSRVPLPQDDVVINASASGTITNDMPRAGRSINFAGFTGTYQPNVTTSIYGNITYVSGMAVTITQAMNFCGRGTHTITSAGKALVGDMAIIAPGGSYTLQDNFNIAADSLTLSNGTFSANNFNVTASNVSSNNTNLRVLTMGSGIWTLNSTSATIWDFTATNLTLNADSSTIIIATAYGLAARTFAGAGMIYNNLTYTVANSPGSLTITGANTFNVLTIGSGRILTMPASTTNTLTTLNAIGAANGFIYLPDASGNYASTPDSAALSITGDIDLRIKIALNDWTPSALGTFFGKQTSTSTRTYRFDINTSGTLGLVLSSNGSTLTTATSSASAPFANGIDGWVRATWRQSDGRVQFFTSSDGSIWTQLGTNQTIAIASIFDSAAALEVGAIQGGSTRMPPGKLYRAQIRNNVLDDGSGIVFDADFAAKPVGTNGFTESSSNAATVTINGAVAQVGDGRISLVSSSGSVAATLSKASGVVSCNYMSIQNSTATGGASWYAGANSVNVSNNTGWIFSGVPGQPSNFMPFFRGGL